MQRTTSISEVQGGGFTVCYCWKDEGAPSMTTEAAFSTYEEAEADVADFYNSEGEWEEEEEE